MDRPPLCNWTVAEVSSALCDEPWAEPDLIKKFEDHQIDGAALIELDKADLREEFGIRELGRIKSILRNIQRLRQKFPSPSARRSLPSVAAAGTPPPEERASRRKPRLYPVEESLPGAAFRYNTPLNCTHEPQESRRHPAQQLPLNEIPEDYKNACNEKLWNEEREKPAADEISIDAISGGKDDGSVLVEHLSLVSFSATPEKQIVAAKTGPKSSSSEITTSSKASTRELVDAMTFKAVHPDLKLAKAKARPKRGREKREAEARVERGLPGKEEFSPGILEHERRQAAWYHLFAAWTGNPKSGEVESKDVQDVIRLFFELSQTDEVTPKAHSSHVDNFPDDFPHSLTCELFVDEMLAVTADLTPIIFDDLISFFYLAIGDQDSKMEAARRFKLFSDIFVLWDVDNSGALGKVKVLQVLRTFNQWAEKEGDEWIYFDLSAFDAAATHDDMFQPKEFVDLMTSLTTRLDKQSFDTMCYRLMRCIDMIKTKGSGDIADSSTGDANLEFRLRKLLQMRETGNPTKIYVFYGLGSDPTKILDVLSKEFGAKMKGSIISSDEAEESALQMLTYQGLGKGWWLFFIVSSGYINADRFLRGVALKLSTRETWMMHKKFRVFVSLSTPSIWHLPPLVMSHVVPVCTKNSV